MNNKSLMTFPLPRVATWGGLSAFLLFLNGLVPNLWDDWGYGFCRWNEILPGVYHEYFTHNGRIVGCTLTRIFALQPSWITDLINTATFLGIILLLSYFALGQEWKKALKSWILPLMAWVILVSTAPIFGECFLWHCGAANYAVPILLVLLFLLPFRRALEKKHTHGAIRPWPLWAVVLFAIPALLAGWSVENMGIVACLAAVFLTWYTWRENPNRYAFLCWALVSLVGWVLMVKAPGPQIRLAKLCSEPGFQPRTILQLTLQLLETHLRAIPLYLVVFFLVLRLRKRGLWPGREQLFLLGWFLAGLMTQGAFYGTVATPPRRAQEITFIFIAIPCLRVMWLSYAGSKHRRHWAAVLAALSLLPLAGVPKLFAMNRWMADSYAQLEEARGKGEDVVLPYWPFEKDLLFGFAREFVTSEYRENWKNTSLAKCMGLSSVVQSDKRCSYLADTPQMRLEGTSYDAPGYVTRTEFRLSPQPERAPGQETLYLHVAYPDTLGHSLTPKKLWRRFVSPRLQATATAGELRADGMRIDHVPVNADGSVSWERGKKYSKKPKCPVIWVSVSTKEEPQEGLLFQRAAPTPFF